jgi:Ca2+/Na+ antiporter
VRLSRALVIGGFFLLVILFVGLLFWPFILNEIITPTSLAVWVLLRIFVLSVDQAYYWVAIIFIIATFLYLRLLPPSHPTIQSEDSQHLNETMRTLDYWRSLFNLIDQRVQDDEMLKKELARLLLSFYATKQHTLADFRLYDALQQGEIPLPEQIHAFLFPEEPQPVGRSFITNIRRLVQSIRNTPRKWIRRWTGQETAERYRMINETLCFMETSLEMKNDDGKFNPHQH